MLLDIILPCAKGYMRYRVVWGYGSWPCFEPGASTSKHKKMFYIKGDFYGRFRGSPILILKFLCGELINIKNNVVALFISPFSFSISACFSLYTSCPYLSQSISLTLLRVEIVNYVVGLQWTFRNSSKLFVHNKKIWMVFLTIFIQEGI